MPCVQVILVRVRTTVRDVGQLRVAVGRGRGRGRSGRTRTTLASGLDTALAITVVYTAFDFSERAFFRHSAITVRIELY